MKQWFARHFTGPDSVMGLRTNPKLCVLTEPMWSIPHALYIPFFVLYMHALGLGDADIGILISVGIFLQMIMAFLGGVASDKFGRRLTTLIADILAWSVPTALWAMAQDFRWFLAAAVFNSVWRVSEVSWQCLLVEDVEAEKIAKLYNWVYISGLLAVFFAPLSVYFIGAFDLVAVMRFLLAFTCVSMTAKFIILYKYGTETDQGRVRMAETKDTPFLEICGQCWGVLAQMFKSPATVRVLALVTVLNIQQIASNNFFALYVVYELGIEEQWLALFPIMRTGVMLVFFLGVQNKLNRFPMYAIMLGGLVTFTAGHVLLLNIPQGQGLMLPMFVFTALDACAAALFLPRRDTLVILNVDPAERARIMSLLIVIMLLLSSPFGYIFGLLSEYNRRIPYMLSIGLFVIMAGIVLLERGRGQPQASQTPSG
ncbi:MAG: MFS transporter [Defluviitaleaceae bacterium]|nr:MFS transporter [Defluviitaleaceae bacterium]